MAFQHFNLVVVFSELSAYVKENAIGYEIEVQFLNIDPTKDFLKIHMDGVDRDQDDSGIILTGKLRGPLLLRSPHSSHLRIEFSTRSTTAHNYTGFSLTYHPYGKVAEVPSKPPQTIIIAQETPPKFSTLLTVKPRHQNNATWMEFRHLLCEGANNFTIRHNLTLEQCYPENVTFTSISRCLQLWPNNADCIEITFTILLYNKSQIETLESESFLNGAELYYPKELATDNLQRMWEEYGKNIFHANRFPTYKPPAINGLILFWAGMATAAVIVFLLFLVIISRLRIFGNYIKWSAMDEDNQNILKKSQDIDITMFPSPHQVVPTLFPTSTNPYSPGSSFLYGGDVYENRPRDAIESFSETDPSLLSDLRGNSSFGAESSSLNSDHNCKDRLRQQELHIKGANQEHSES